MNRDELLTSSEKRAMAEEHMEEIKHCRELIHKIYKKAATARTKDQTYESINALLKDPRTPMSTLAFCHFMRAALLKTSISPIHDLKQAVKEFAWTFNKRFRNIHGKRIPRKDVMAMLDVSKACVEEHSTCLGLDKKRPGTYKAYIQDVWYDRNEQAVRDMMDYFDAFYTKHYLIDDSK